MSEQTLLRCERLVIGHEGKSILPPLDLSLERGSFVVVVGRNGSGKSTWFRTVLGLLPPVAGRVVRARPDLRFAFESQTIALDRTLPLRVSDVVGWGRISRWGFLRRPSPSDSSVIAKAMEEAHVSELGDPFFRDLSEGQKQRVLLARLLATEPDVALLDEPTSAMDAIAERRTLAQLGELTKRRHMLTIVVSHVLGAAAEQADVVVFFDREDEVVVSGPPRHVFADERFRKHFGFVGADAPDGAHL